MTRTPDIGDRALLAVDVVADELCGSDRSLIVECPNGERTIAAPGHLLPHLTTTELARVGRLVKAVGHLAVEGHYELGDVSTDDTPHYVCVDSHPEVVEVVRELEAMAPLVYRMGW